MAEADDTVKLCDQDHWVQSVWRPAMAWLYMAICFMDFIGFPFLSFVYPIISKQPYAAWVPLTLQNGGMIHLAFGAVIGINAWIKRDGTVLDNTSK